MAGYTKIFGSLLHSTVWQAPAPTRLVWITMMVLSDRDGLVEASVPGLARAANVTLEECEEALAAFLAPDKYSRTPDHDGRRIDVIRGGWRLLNFEYYRELKSPEHVREQDAERQQRKRDREAASRTVTGRHGPSHDVQSVTESPPSGSDQAHPDLPLPLLGSGPDRVPVRSEERAENRVFPPQRPERRLDPFDATLAFQDVFRRYPNQNARLKAAQVWQDIVVDHPGGEEALRSEIAARFDAGMLKAHPYAGLQKYRPTFETFLRERRWEDAVSAPDDEEPASARGGTATGYREIG